MRKERSPVKDRSNDLRDKLKAQSRNEPKSESRDLRTHSQRDERLSDRDFASHRESFDMSLSDQKRFGPGVSVGQDFNRKPDLNPGDGKTNFFSILLASTRDAIFLYFNRYTHITHCT